MVDLSEANDVAVVEVFVEGRPPEVEKQTQFWKSYLDFKLKIQIYTIYLRFKIYIRLVIFL